MKKYVCTICGYIYDESAGIPASGVAAGTKWEELPEDWKCPLCGAPKSNFKEQGGAPEEKKASEAVSVIEDAESYRELSAGELSALCSNLARGCEKQYLARESELLKKLADYFKAKAPAEPNEELLTFVKEDLERHYPSANQAAAKAGDRGALRALVWNEKVSHIMKSLLDRYESEGEAFLKYTSVYVCTICGFIYIGEQPPVLCPVCKVPDWKFQKIERRNQA